MSLSLAEQVVVLSRKRSGRLRTESLLARAGTAAAVFAELRLAARLSFDPRMGVVVAYDDTPTGDRLIDSVLARVVAEKPARPYQWLDRLGLDVYGDVSQGLGFAVHGNGVRTGGNRRIDRPDAVALASELRPAMRAALAAGELDSRVVVLGTVLWGAELIGAVLGWRAPVDHVTLGHYAARDWLGIAIRNVAVLARVELADGQPREAVAHASEALAIQQQTGNPLGVRRAEEVLGRTETVYET